MRNHRLPLDKTQKGVIVYNKGGSMKKVSITKEGFQAYERVRQSGVTNMYNIAVVEDLADLSKEEVMAIMKDYRELLDKYGVEEGK